ncbi:MAG: SO_0444 family Cu/Zn efflux transporter [Planctomycetota bacterium]
MESFVTEWLSALWMVLAESGPYLLVGFVLAGLLAVLVPTRWVAKRLGGDDVKSVATAAVIGVPVPLCSCSVIPTATQLRRSGASRGATTSFLIATPETGVDSIGATWALMDPLMTIVRPLAAFVTAFSSGVAVNLLGRGRSESERESLESAEDAPADGEAPAVPHCHMHAAAETAEAPAEHDHGSHGHAGHDHAGHDHSHDADGDGSVPRRALRYAFGTLLDDLTPWFLVGFALSAAIVVAVPDEFFAGTFLTGWAAMFGMLIAGVPLYVCATASTPIAAAMMAKGLEPGAALVFLLAGPATNVATILVVRNLLGKRALVAYLVSIAVVSLLIGALVNALYPLLGFDPTDMDVQPGAMDHGVVANVSGAILALLLARSAWRLRLDRSLGAWLRRVGRPIGLDPTAVPVKAIAGLGVALVYASTAVTVVGPGETVFVERFGRVAREGATPGALVHAPWPIDVAHRVDTGLVRSLEFGVDRKPIDDSTIEASALRAERERLARLDAEAETLTGDGLLLSVRFGIQFRVEDARAWRYGQSDPEALVGRLAQDAVRRTVALRPADSVLVGDSGAFLDEVEARIVADLEASGVGAALTSFQLHDLHAPPAVHDAYRKVASAIEDADRNVAVAEIRRMETLSEARTAALERTSAEAGRGMRVRALARGEAQAYEALVQAHASAPGLVEQDLLFDSLLRALRPDGEGERRIVLPLGEGIEVISRLKTGAEPPPDVFEDEFFMPPKR